jgi:hypothetical protein
MKKALLCRSGWPQTHPPECWDYSHKHHHSHQYLFFENESGYFAQTGLKLLGSSSSPASASRVAGTTGIPSCQARKGIS